MKTNKFMRIASVLLVAVVLTTCAISGTFAKYTSESTGTATGRVATWAFNVDGNNIVEANTFTFDLFDTITEVGGGTEAEVDAGVIAPGTQGEFALALANASEVDAQYAITFTYSGTPTLKFKLAEDDEWTTDIATLNIAASADTQLDFAGGTTASDNVTIYWMWDFGNSVNDNAAAGTEVTVTAAVTVTQVD